MSGMSQGQGLALRKCSLLSKATCSYASDQVRQSPLASSQVWLMSCSSPSERAHVALDIPSPLQLLYPAARGSSPAFSTLGFSLDQSGEDHDVGNGPPNNKTVAILT